MPSIKPFKGILYNPDRFKDLSELAAPPYDVITKRMQSRLYGSSPYNIVRLTLGRTRPSDGIDDNRYTRAEKFLRDWLKSRVLVQDRKDSLYVYSQRYGRAKNSDIERIGFIGLMGLDMSKRRKVLPHENTLLEPKLDRLSLIRSTKANLEPVFVLYEDPGHKILKILKRVCLENSAFIDIEFDGIRNRMWRLNDRSAIRRIGDAMRPKTAVIADGHHRYEAARTCSMEVRDSALPHELKNNSRYMMAYFAELDKKTLTILPAHRVIKDMGILKNQDVKDRLKRFFLITKARGLDDLMMRLESSRYSYAFGMYLKNDGFYLLRLKNPRSSDRLIKNSSTVWKRLDVTILHLFILEEVLGIRDEDDNVEFVKEPKDAKELVDRSGHRIAFFLNPTKVLQVKKVASLGERMPRKATYFYPKPLSGLVINKL